FLVLLAYAAAEQGYNYEPSQAHQGYETPAIHDDFEQHADYHKHFFAFEAPQDAGEQADLAEQSIAAIAKKNLQVVFIKAPENKGVEGALNALIKQSNVDKTAIYVLNKQTDAQELASKFSALQAQHKHKPQVHFVKYRTEAEAAHAQQQIRAKY
ncbi:TwdlR, partial [Drosophila busckii]